MTPEDVIIDPTLPLDEFLGQAVGAASTCWSDMKGQGVFESERAIQIKEEIIAYISQLLVNKRYAIADEIDNLGANRNPDDPEGSAVFSRHATHIVDRIRNPHLYSGVAKAPSHEVNDDYPLDATPLG